jgi:hypothetical protein
MEIVPYERVALAATCRNELIAYNSSRTNLNRSELHCIAPQLDWAGVGPPSLLPAGRSYDPNPTYLCTVIWIGPSLAPCRSYGPNPTYLCTYYSDLVWSQDRETACINFSAERTCTSDKNLVQCF